MSPHAAFPQEDVPCTACGTELQPPPAARPAPLTFSVDAVGDRCVVLVCGELDLESNPILQQALSEALTRATGGVELDLSGVGFCDCAALNVLLHMHHRAQETAKAFTVRATSPAVHRLLTLTGTLPHLTQGCTPADGQPAVSASRASDGAAPTAPTDDQAEHADPSDDGLAVENAQLHRAMETRAPIDLARGMLMASFHLTAEQAWQVLVTASQHSNTKLREIADALLQTADGRTPLPESLAGHVATAVRSHTGPAS
jgi:anti-anti-sigma factor